MNPRRIYAIMLRQWYLLRSSPTRLVPYFLWSVLDVILWGFITRYLGGVTSEGMQILPTLLGAVLIWDFLTRVMQGITTAFFEDVWSQNFLNMFASPIKLSEYVTGLILTSVITTSATFVVIICAALLFFGFSVFSFGIALGMFLLVLFLMGVALGIFAVSLVLRFGPSAEWLIWPIPAVLAPFVGVFYPIASLPLFFRGLAKLLPPSYVFEGMRTFIATGHTAFIPLLFAATLSLVYIFVAYLFLARVYRYVIRHGLVTRYSAESV